MFLLISCWLSQPFPQSELSQVIDQSEPSNIDLTEHNIPAQAEESFHQALLKRNGDLTPSDKEQNAITNLVTKIQTVLDTLIVSPGNFDACVS